MVARFTGTHIPNCLKTINDVNVNIRVFSKYYLAEQVVYYANLGSPARNHGRKSGRTRMWRMWMGVPYKQLLPQGRAVCDLYVCWSAVSRTGNEQTYFPTKELGNSRSQFRVMSDTKCRVHVTYNKKLRWQ